LLCYVLRFFFPLLKEIALQQVMSHIGGVKKDMIILEKSEFSALCSENEVKLTVLESAILAFAYFF